jgi:hypothetical protein
MKQFISSSGAIVLMLTPLACSERGDTATSSARSLSSASSAASGCIAVGPTFNSEAFSKQTGSFTITFSATPNRNNTDAAFGLSPNAPSSYNDFAVEVAFTYGGVFAIATSSGFVSSHIPYSAGVTYQIDMDVNISAKTYSAYVTAPGGSKQTIIQNTGFRWSQPSPSSLSYFGAIDDVGTDSVCSLVLNQAAPPPTACQMTVPSCPNHPAVSGTFDDSYTDAGYSVPSSQNQGECMQRAQDYYNWCGASQPVTASYLISGVAAQTTTYPSESATTKVDDTDSSVIYSRSAEWTQGSGSMFYGGTDHYNNACQNPPQPLTPIQGPMAVINFKGTGISMIGEVGSNFGIGAYAIDSGPLHQVDAYNSVDVFQKTLFSVSGLAPGSHALSYQVTCYKNAASSNFYQAIDAYVITGTPLPVSSAQLGNLGAVTFEGAWIGDTATLEHVPPPFPAGSNGGAWSHTAGDSISWTFTGSLVEMYGQPDVGDGLFDVYIDDVLVAAKVDMHYTTVDDDLVDYYMIWAGKVAYGTHTIKIVVLGTEDSYNESESYGGKDLIQFNEFLAFP